MQTGYLYIERLGAASPSPVKPEKLLKREGFEVILGETERRDGAPASYATVVCGAIPDGDTARRCSRALAETMRGMIKSPPRRILVAGLGNPKISADALGSRTAELVLTQTSGTPALFTVSPGIPSGLTSAETVAMFASRLDADLIVAVDALAARTPERLASLVQVSNAGISPGSGASSAIGAIDAENMGCAVISVGVPTVISADHFTGERSGGSGKGGAKDVSGRADTALYAPVGIDRTVDLFAASVAGGINLFAAKISGEG